MNFTVASLPVGVDSNVAPSPVPRQKTGFFRHHGIWAFGVRMFRRMSFSQKACSITAVFLVPIGVLTWSFLDVQQTQLASTAKERRGIEYQQAVQGLLRTAVAHQWAAAQAKAPTGGAQALNEASAAASAQLKKLQDVDTALGAELGTAEPMKALMQAAAALTQASGNTSEPSAPHFALIDATLALADHIDDSSGLALDPDADSYYLMNAMTADAPDLLMQLARARAVGAEVLTAGAATPAQTRLLTRLVPLASRRSADLKSGMGKVAAANPAVAAKVNPTEAGVSVEKFIAQVEAAPLAQDGPKGDAADYAKRGSQAIESAGDMLVRGTEELAQLLAARTRALETKRNVVMAALGVCLLLVAYMFRSFFMVLDGGLKEVERHITAISEGNLSTQPHAWGSDEAARLLTIVQTLQGSLSGMVRKVRDSADSVAHSSSEVATGATDLSGRTEQAAGRLEETAAAMEQLAVTVRHTADNAQHAAALASENSKVAERGGVVIGQVVATMQDIHASSSKIGEIIGTIDGIAFQTNILALNAAVEAARAGEQGRGFAVVASEVRALAQRSAAAAREIKALISTSVDKVASGTNIVQGAGKTMQELVVNARKMNELVADISTATSEQSTGIAQVGQAVQEMDRMTQQNAALVEQTSSAATALNDQAGQLIAEVGVFKLAA